MGCGLRYLRASTLEEALAVLAEDGWQGTRPLAGGTDLMVELRNGGISGGCLLDISRVAELRRIEVEDGKIRIGACVTFSEILEHEGLAVAAPLLQKAAGTIGSPQIRNVATLGGNVANSSPAADSLPALLVHESRVVLASLEGWRDLPLDAFLVGPYRNARRPRELIVELVLQSMASGCHWDYLKVARRKALAIARLNLALMVKKAPDGRLELVRLALGAATPTPRRMESVEQILCGRPLNLELLREAAGLLAHEMVEQAGVRASTAYKSVAVQGLLIRGLLPLLDGSWKG